MKVFLSHAYSDRELATGVKHLIESSSMGLVDVWLSSALDGLKPGDVLLDEVHRNLSDSDKIITLLTPSSINRPWLTYESGYVAGKKSSQVIPLVCGITKEKLPMPLSAYIIYSLLDSVDFYNLIITLVKHVLPKPSENFIESNVKEFIDGIEKTTQFKLEAFSHDENKPKIISKQEASNILHQQLSDYSCKHIKIITYTNEVEAGALNKYKISSPKEIEIFKRSIISDYRDQQVDNIKKIAANFSGRRWDKINKSFDSTVILENEFNDFDEINIKQYFFDHSPYTRAYIFDDKKAVISYFEVSEKQEQVSGSKYKGMEKSPNLLIDNTTEIGRFLLSKLSNDVSILRSTSRTWNAEKELVCSSEPELQIIKPPILKIEAVCFDLDGILYDSLPNYLISWKSGFKKIGFDLPEKEVYELEGMPGKQTIRYIFDKYFNRQVSDEELMEIKQEKDNVFNSSANKIFDGALDLLRNIHNRAIPIYIVTGSSEKGIKDRIIRDFSPYIKSENIITGEDVPLGKPNPAPFLSACKKGQHNPSNVLVIENAPLGLKSASRAGCFCIAVNSGPLKDIELLKSGAVAVFDSMQNLSNNWLKVVNEIGLNASCSRRKE